MPGDWGVVPVLCPLPLINLPCNMRIWPLCAVLVGLILSVSDTAAQAPHVEENLYGPGVIGKLFELNPTITTPIPFNPTYTGYARGDVETGVEIMEFEDAPMVEMNGISDNGEIVVGRQFRHPGLPEIDRSIVRWAPFSGTMEIGGTNTGMGRPVVSGPGNTVYGTTDPDEDEPWWLIAGRWAPSTFDWTTWNTLYDLDHVPTPPENWATEANGISLNGLHLVGLHYERGLWIPRPYHWTEQDGQGWVDLPVLDENEAWVVPNSVSNDGSIIVGGHSRLPTGSIFGVRWVNGEPEWILNNNGEHAGELLACNSDCSIVSGNAVGNLIYGSALAYRWTEEGGVQYLQPFEGAPEPARYWASDISEDGSVIIGGYVYQVEVDGWITDVIRAFLWFDNEDGGTMHDLHTWLGYHGVNFFDDWRHVTGMGISSDGRFLVGSGDRPEGNNLVIRSWRMELPENETYCLITSSMAFDNAIVGVPNTTEAVVTNAGTGTCELAGASVDNDAFSIDFTPTNLVPGAQARFNVTFHADETGNYEGELTFESPEGDFSGTLVANALNPPIAHLEVTEVVFEIKDDPEDSRTITLRNQALFGSATLTYEIVDISQVDGPEYEDVVTVDPMEGTVPPASNRSLTVSVNTSGLNVGSHTYEVTIATNDPENPELVLTVVVMITTSGEGDGDAVGFELHPAYPNPFRNETAIAFELPHAEHVVIEVLDLTGRRVAVLVDEHMPGGRHDVRWDASDLASGTYLYRIQAGAFSKTLRTTLVR